MEPPALGGLAGARIEESRSLDSIAESAAQLDRVSSFFGRLESKSSFLVAIDGLMLGMVLVNLKSSDVENCYMLISLSLTGLLLGGSLIGLYRAWMPSLETNRPSLIYFQQIALLSESEYEDRFLKRSDEAHAKDLASQIWRNSVILDRKFKLVNIAFRLTAFALIPWFFFMLGSIALHGELPLLP